MVIVPGDIVRMNSSAIVIEVLNDEFDLLHRDEVLFVCDVDVSEFSPSMTLTLVRHDHCKVSLLVHDRFTTDVLEVIK